MLIMLGTYVSIFIGILSAGFFAAMGAAKILPVNKAVLYKVIAIILSFFILAGSFITIFIGKNLRNLIESEFAMKVANYAGFAYDKEQNIYYSTMYAWQRKMGYCSLYDEGAALMGMIIDCEPIYFEYDNKRWLIEFWKGQYDLTTGCEIGVYNAKKYRFIQPYEYKRALYKCVSDEDRLQMSFLVEKNGEKLFEISDKHWWLTGFVLGEFSNPSELVMHLSITLKDEDMLNAFIGGLEDAGYEKNEIEIENNTVKLVFDTPKSTQPFTRTEKTDEIIQKKNKILCDIFNHFMYYDE